MDPLVVISLIVLLIVLAGGWLLTLLGMPGNWLMVAATLVYSLLVPAESQLAVGMPLVIITAVLAVLGEIVEMAAAAVGTATRGGSRRGAVLALLGSLVGAVVGMVVGLPIPLVGPVLAALLFAGLGALVGAILGEQWKGRSLDESWQIGKAAFWGRIVGTLGKMVIGSVIVATVVAALWV